MVAQSWKELMAILPTLDENELVVAINTEVSGFKRKGHIERMHQRYSKLRAKRERDALVAGDILL